MSNSERIDLNISATDNASDTLEDVAELVDELEKASPEIDVGADTASADADLKETKELADQLTKADAEIVIKAKIDQAKADLKDLQAELKATGDTAAAEGDRAGDSMSDFGEDTGKAQDAVHGLAGEAVAELPTIGPALGPASEAVGQLTEGLLAGEIGFKDLAKAAAPVAGITAGLWALSRGAEQAAKRTAELEQIIKDLSRASDEEALRSLDRAMMDVLLNGGDFNQFFADMAANNLEGTKRLLELTTAQGASVVMTDALRAAVVEEERARAQQEQTTAKYGETAKTAAVNVGKLAGDTSRAGEAARDGAEDFSKSEQAVYKWTKQVEKANTQIDTLQGNLDFDQLALNFRTAFDEAMTKAQEGTELTAQEVLDLKQDYLDTAKAIGEDPVTIQSNLKKIEEGDIGAVLWDTQSKINQHEPTELPVKPKLDPAELRRIQREIIEYFRQHPLTTGGPNDPDNPNNQAAGTSSAVINVALPRGFREVDVVAAARSSLRRNGRLYSFGR
jgi:hypothetical protein